MLLMEPDWIQLTIARKFTLPSGWAWCRSTVIDGSGHFLVEGGIPHTITRGPRKGRRTWKKSVLTQYVITKSDMDLTKRLLDNPGVK
jgi:hypothetical protein